MARKSLYRRGNKYNARGERYKGMYFPSQTELSRYKELELLERAGKVRDLRAHPKYQMVCPHCHEELPVTFVADTEYKEFTGNRHGPVRLVAEDVKSPATKTGAYRIRAALMRHCHPEIDFREVM